MVILSVVEWKKRERAVKREDQKGEKRGRGDRREKEDSVAREREEDSPFSLSFLLLF